MPISGQAEGLTAHTHTDSISWWFLWLKGRRHEKRKLDSGAARCGALALDSPTRCHCRRLSIDSAILGWIFVTDPQRLEVFLVRTSQSSPLAQATVGQELVGS